MRKADNLPSSCAVVTKYGNLNFLEPSGPLLACNGTALPLPFHIIQGVSTHSRVTADIFVWILSACDWVHPSLGKVSVIKPLAPELIFFKF